MNSMTYDLLAVGPHPDDLEIGCGGTIKKLTEQGKKVAILDLTQGEMSSRGTIEIRKQEAKKAAELLGVATRINAGLKDAQIFNTFENQQKIIKWVRTLRPTYIVAPYWECRHPDHYRSSDLIYEAAFLSGLKKYEDGLEAFRPERIFYYMLHTEFTPSFIVDVTNQMPTKRESLLAYHSQFSTPSDDREYTYIAGKAFLDQVEVRNRYYGNLIGRTYGEPFIMKEVSEVDNPIDFLASQGKSLNRPISNTPFKN